jgi:hypothetical protein
MNAGAPTWPETPTEMAPVNAGTPTNNHRQRQRVRQFPGRLRQNRLTAWRVWPYKRLHGPLRPHLPSERTKRWATGIKEGERRRSRRRKRSRRRRTLIGPRRFTDLHRLRRRSLAAAKKRSAADFDARRPERKQCESFFPARGFTLWVGIWRDGKILSVEIQPVAFRTTIQALHPRSSREPWHDRVSEG